MPKASTLNKYVNKIQESIKSGRELTDAEKARIERNRLKALHIRHAKLVSHPHAKNDTVINNANETADKTIIKVQGTRFFDSGGGFLIEEPALKTSTAIKILNPNEPSSLQLSNEEAISIPVTYDECLECGDQFADSYLLNNFDHPVCDKCRDPDEKHTLITRTQAKEDYLLKDCDFDKRKPPLKYISRKNPHNVRWGEMKLYLLLQVEKRALEVWGNEEELEKQREKRVEKRSVSKIKKYNKQMKQLRMEVRSSVYDKTSITTHTHEFGPETYNEDDDTYTHQCLTCQYLETFEKM